MLLQTPLLLEHQIVGLTTLPSSARDPRGLKTNGTRHRLSRSQMEEMSRGWFALHTQS